MIGIVILNYNNYHATEECVQSIIINPPKEEYRIIIVDNGSKNDSFNILREKYFCNPDIIFKRNVKNVGFAAGNNRGIKVCQSLGIRECILTNSDIIFQFGVIDKMIQDLRTDSKTVIVGPKILLHEKVQHSSCLKKIRLIDSLEFGRMFPRRRLSEEKQNGLHTVYSVSGCCFAVQISLFCEMGALDETTFLYNEENIMGFQANKARFKTKIDLDISVIHNHGASTGPETDFTKQVYINGLLYYWHHYRMISQCMLWGVLIAFSLKLMLKRESGIHPRLIYHEGKRYMKELVKS